MARYQYVVMVFETERDLPESFLTEMVSGAADDPNVTASVEILECHVGVEEDFEDACVAAMEALA